jgi:hypothetical protein
MNLFVDRPFSFVIAPAIIVSLEGKTNGQDPVVVGKNTVVLRSRTRSRRMTHIRMTSSNLAALSLNR